MRTTLTRLALASAMLGLLSGCAHYTLDDGRKVDDVLLRQIRTYAQGTQALRPAIVLSAKLQDKDCATQWELPFDTATSYAVDKDDDKVAWVRGAGIDEHLRVIATSPAANLEPGDILKTLDGYESRNATKMAARLAKLRDDGEPFDAKLGSGRTVRITPLKVCRGRTLLAQPGKKAEQQDYHWRQTTHPVQIVSAPLTADEAQWVVLWTQGLSEEGSLRMRSYRVGVGLVKLASLTALSVATLGAGAAAAGGALAAGASIGSAAGAVALANTPLIAAQIATAAAGNAATLYGINWVASTAFHKADKWAFEHMPLLGMDPRAGLTFELKLAQGGATRNAFLLDKERQAQMDTLIAGLRKENGTEVGAPIADAGLATPLTEAAQDAQEPRADVPAKTAGNSVVLDRAAPARTN